MEFCEVHGGHERLLRHCDSDARFRSRHGAVLPDVEHSLRRSSDACARLESVTRVAAIRMVEEMLRALSFMYVTLMSSWYDTIMRQHMMLHVDSRRFAKKEWNE